MTSKKLPLIHSMHLPLQSRLKAFCGSISIFVFTITTSIGTELNKLLCLNCDWFLIHQFDHVLDANIQTFISHLKCESRGKTGGPYPPRKPNFIWVSIGNKQLDSSWKKLDPLWKM